MLRTLFHGFGMQLASATDANSNSMQTVLQDTAVSAQSAGAQQSAGALEAHYSGLLQEAHAEPNSQRLAKLKNLLLSGYFSPLVLSSWPQYAAYLDDILLEQQQGGFPDVHHGIPETSSSAGNAALDGTWLALLSCAHM